MGCRRSVLFFVIAGVGVVIAAAAEITLNPGNRFEDILSRRRPLVLLCFFVRGDSRWRLLFGSSSS